MFSKIKISVRLGLIIIVMLAGMVAFAFMGMKSLYANLMIDRQNQTKAITESAISIIAKLDERAQKGEFSIEEAQKRAVAAVGSLRYDKTNYIFGMNNEGIFTIHPRLQGEKRIDDKDANGFPYFREFLKVSANGGGFVPYVWIREQGKPAVPKISYIAPFTPWGWTIGTGIYIDDVDQVFMENAKKVAGISLALFIVIGGIIVVISRSITSLLNRITRGMNRLADGDKTIDVPFTDNRNEIGDLARALETFKASAIRMDQLEADQKEQQAKASQERRAMLLKLAEDFDSEVKGVVDGVSSAAAEMQHSAQSMSDIAGETSNQAQTVSKAAEQTANNVQTVASAAEELNSSIGEINRQIGESVTVAGACMKEAEATSEVMKSLSKSAEDIGNVVKLIENIASQVNLLALNATIEAARAGDAGRGFAVVANEVKNLANQVGRAAQDITKQIEGIQGQTGNAVTTIESITTTIRRVNEISTTIADAVNQQGAATKEISRSIQDTAQGTSEVTQNIDGVTRAASETGEAAGQLLNAASQVAQQSEMLRVAVDNFVNYIRKR